MTPRLKPVAYIETSVVSYLASRPSRDLVEAVCREAGYEPPVICTPNELMEPEPDGRR